MKKSDGPLLHWFIGQLRETATELYRIDDAKDWSVTLNKLANELVSATRELRGCECGLQCECGKTYD